MMSTTSSWWPFSWFWSTPEKPTFAKIWEKMIEKAVLGPAPSELSESLRATVLESSWSLVELPSTVELEEGFQHWLACGGGDQGLYCRWSREEFQLLSVSSEVSSGLEKIWTSRWARGLTHLREQNTRIYVSDKESTVKTWPIWANTKETPTVWQFFQKLNTVASPDHRVETTELPQDTASLVAVIKAKLVQ